MQWRFDMGSGLDGGPFGDGEVSEGKGAFREAIRRAQECAGRVKMPVTASEAGAPRGGRRRRGTQGEDTACAANCDAIVYGSSVSISPHELPQLFRP